MLASQKYDKLKHAILSVSEKTEHDKLMKTPIMAEHPSVYKCFWWETVLAWMKK